VPQLLVVMEVVPQALERRKFWDAEEVEICARPQPIVQAVSRLEQGKQGVTIRRNAVRMVVPENLSEAALTFSKSVLLSLIASRSDGSSNRVRH
jgi:hypothetical protein